MTQGRPVPKSRSIPAVAEARGSPAPMKAPSIAAITFRLNERPLILFEHLKAAILLTTPISAVRGRQKQTADSGLSVSALIMLEKAGLK